MARLTRDGAPHARHRRAGARTALAWLVAATLAAGPLHAQGEGLAVDSVHVAVRLHVGIARVEASYWLARTPRVVDFMFLASACSAVGEVRAARGDLPVTFAADTNAPWVSWHDTTDVPAPADAPVVYRVAYDVTWRGEAPPPIPLAHPARPLTARSAPVIPLVHLGLEDSSGAHHPTFPRLDRVSPTRWAASLVAMPSTIAIEGPGDRRDCEPGDGIGGTNDGFTRRMGLLALTMLLWIPLYFWWAMRPRPGEDEAGAA